MKTNKLGYRNFFGLMLMLWIAVLGQSLLAADSLKWFRGQLHSHTYLSDGRGFPEQAIETYKQRGYQFLSISDHNRFAADTNLWRETGRKLAVFDTK